MDNFTTEYAEVRTEILNDATLENKQFLIGPSVCCDKVGFELDDVFATGWLDQEKDNLAYVAVQQYVNISCDSGWPWSLFALMQLPRRQLRSQRQLP